MTRGAMRKLSVLVPVLVVVAALASGCGSRESRAAALRAETEGANVLVVVVDGLAAAHSSAYRSPRDTTPALAGLAVDSIRFVDVTAGSSSPYASTLTLHYGETLDLLGATRPGELPAETSALAGLGARFGGAGYDVVAVSTNPAVSAVAEELLGARAVDVPRTPGAGVPEAVHAEVEGLLTGSRGAPFFAYVHLSLPLAPRAPSASSAQALLGYVPERDAGDPEFLRGLGGPKKPPEETLVAVIDAYDATLRDVDAAIGRWIELLRRTDREEDTLLVVAGSSGQAFGQRGRFGVGSGLHQEEVAVPLFVRLPGGHSGGTSIVYPVALYDLAPSLTDLLSLGGPPHRSGASWLPLVTGDWFERAQPVIARTGGANPLYAVRQDHFKLLSRADGGGAKLHHLERDPLETTDHGVPRPETLRELRTTLSEYLRALGKTPAPRSVEIEPELSARLEKLGY